MMEESDEYARIQAQYQLVYVAYEEAVDEMLMLASDPECGAERYKEVSIRVHTLSEQMTALREAMLLLHGRRGGMLPEPPMPEPGM